MAVNEPAPAETGFAVRHLLSSAARKHDAQIRFDVIILQRRPLSLAPTPNGQALAEVLIQGYPVAMVTRPISLPECACFPCRSGEAQLWRNSFLNCLATPI